MRCSLVLAVAIAMTGCTPAICSRTSDCLTGRVCTTYGRCEVPVDASTVIDGTPTSDDAGTGDTELHDASLPIDAAIDAGDPLDDGGP
jgi:hypothetical protein